MTVKRRGVPVIRGGESEPESRMRDVRDVAIRGAEPAEEIQVAAHDAEDVGFVVPGNEHRLSAGHGPERAQTDDLPLKRRRLTLLIQNASPGKDMESNWLPAPKGPFSGIMRLYLPQADALTGKWTAPPLTRVE